MLTEPSGQVGSLPGNPGKATFASSEAGLHAAVLVQTSSSQGPTDVCSGPACRDANTADCSHPHIPKTNVHRAQSQKLPSY